MRGAFAPRLTNIGEAILDLFAPENVFICALGSLLMGGVLMDSAVTHHGT